MVLTLAQVVNQAKEQLSSLTGRQPSSVAAAHQDEQGWHVCLEMVEKLAIPDRMDLLGLYEVLLDEQGMIVKFERRSIRTRGEKIRPPEEI